jgi:hypothetical protein
MSIIDRKNDFAKFPVIHEIDDDLWVINGMKILYNIKYECICYILHIYISKQNGKRSFFMFMKVDGGT